MTIKDSILDALIRSVDISDYTNRKLSKIYESIVYDIALFDYPKNWPNALDSAV